LKLNFSIKNKLRIGVFFFLIIFIAFQYILIKSLIHLDNNIKQTTDLPVEILKITRNIDSSIDKILRHSRKLSFSNEKNEIITEISKIKKVTNVINKKITLLSNQNTFIELNPIIENVFNEFSKLKGNIHLLFILKKEKQSLKNNNNEVMQPILNSSELIDEMLQNIEKQTFFRTEKIEKILADSTHRIYLFSFISIIVLSFFTILYPYYFSKLFIRKLNRLSTAASDIASGNLKKRIMLKGNDKFTEVSIQFNIMADHLNTIIDSMENTVKKRTEELENTNKKIKKLNNRLEREVRKRTKELEERINKLNRSKKAMVFMIQDLNIVSRKLKSTQKELLIKERLAAVGQISGNIAHELRNPLGVIDSSIYYIKSKLNSKDPKIIQHLERIKSNVDSSVGIIESLLNITRMKKPKMGSVELKSLIMEVLKDIKLNSGIKVDKIWKDEKYIVSADRTQLKISIGNIIQNASDELGVKGLITISLINESNKFIKISIKDNGKGINPEDIENIFEPLFTKKAKGIGFGLSISRLIIKNHNGKIEVRSTKGEGAEFIIALPSSM